MMNYLILVGSWIIYLALHSLFAATPVKNFFKEKLYPVYKIYRFLYTLFSSIGILVIFYLIAIIEPHYIFPIIREIQYAGMILAVWGVMLIVASFRKLSGLAFLGLQQQPESKLVKEGIHGKIRHPIYSGTILIFIGMFLYSPSATVLISLAVVFLYLPVGIYFEEKKLIAEYGSEYKAYRKEVPAIMPRIF